VSSARRVDAQEHRSAAEDAGLDAQGMGSLKNAVAADKHIPGLFPKVSPWASPTRLDKASDTHLLNRQSQCGSSCWRKPSTAGAAKRYALPVLG